ncbi:alpha/beta hydrolase family protein [Paenibacillus sp. HW567]|uniref:alpha/beta hydrolase family protein n=1 Tax=Paenibacillus sp. HW567 TaxID=1034769 RepID=UPI000372D29D|nr:alpha/beta fold hydrolase [Paenibacillus sp. HW567]
MKIIFQDPTFSFELLRTMSYSSYGGADVGECLSTAYRIQEGDFESWYTEWNNTANRIHSIATESMERGHRVSAREAFLRASNYYRTAEFFLHGNPQDPRLHDTWQKSRNSFRQALAFMDISVDQVKIPFEGTFLPGYFYYVDQQPRSTLIIHGGYDSTGEELYFGGALAALQRGYNCLTFEGPGQGGVIREQSIPFRHDWEHVITPVIDYLQSRPEVDPLRIALMGISMGGFLAPRAAAFEHRLAACIANDGLFNFQIGAFRGLMKESESLDQFFSKLMESSTQFRWAIENGMFTFMAATYQELIDKSEPFTLEGVAQHIKCPVLVCEAENDHFFHGQPQMLYDALSCQKTYMRFTAEEGGEEHCHFGALQLFNQRIFAWLDDVMR